MKRVYEVKPKRIDLHPVLNFVLAITVLPAVFLLVGWFSILFFPFLLPFLDGSGRRHGHVAVNRKKMTASRKKFGI
jgi:hypothetical protein